MRRLATPARLAAAMVLLLAAPAQAGSIPPMLPPPPGTPQPPAPSIPTLPIPPAPPSDLTVTPTWIRLPTSEDLGRLFPERALRLGLSGKVVMQCDVAAKGLLENCQILVETPPDAGFGDATLQMAPLFQMTEKTAEGEDTLGGQVRIPVSFSAPQ